MATENILMACVQAGGDRQAVHEAIREHSMAAGCAVKQSGADNDLLERIANDPIFAPAASSLSTIVDPRAFIVGEAFALFVRCRPTNRRVAVGTCSRTGRRIPSRPRPARPRLLHGRPALRPGRAATRLKTDHWYWRHD